MSTGELGEYSLDSFADSSKLRFPPTGLPDVLFRRSHKVIGLVGLIANKHWVTKVMILLHGEGDPQVAFISRTQPIVKQFALGGDHSVKLEAVYRAKGTVAKGSPGKAAGIATDVFGNGDRLGVYDDQGMATVAFREGFYDMPEANEAGVGLDIAGVVGEDAADDGPPGGEVRMPEAVAGQTDGDEFSVGDLLVFPFLTMRKAFL